jgi:hypothetical protein
MDQFPQQRSNRSNTNNPKEKESIFYSFTPLAAVAALLRNCVRGRRAVACSVRGLRQGVLGWLYESGAKVG